MLRKIRIALAVVFWLGITLLLLDFTGALHGWLGWMAKVQFLPAVMALNVAVIVGLVLLTLVFGRVYCSVICPLGVFQDGVAHLNVARKRKNKNRKPYSYSPEMKWLRYGVWAVFVIALIVGVQALVALLAPYSAWGRIVQNLFQPVYLWVNNLFAAIAERAGSYAFYEKEVWLRSLPTFLVAIATLVVVVVLAWRNGRTYCNTICPVGTTLSFFSRFAMFRPMIDANVCKGCKQCEHNCKAACIDVENRKIDYSRCVDCFNCIDTCKFGGLKYRFAWGKKEIPSPAAPVRNDKEAVRNDNVTPSEAKESQGRRAFIAGAALAVGTAALKAQEKKVDGGFATILDKEVPERDIPLTPPGSTAVRGRVPEQRAPSVDGPQALHAARDVLRARLLPPGVHPLLRTLPDGRHPEDHQGGEDAVPCGHGPRERGTLRGGKGCGMRQLRPPLPRRRHHARQGRCDRLPPARGERGALHRLRRLREPVPGAPDQRDHRQRTA